MLVPLTFRFEYAGVDFNCFNGHEEMIPYIPHTLFPDRDEDDWREDGLPCSLTVNHYRIGTWLGGRFGWEFWWIEMGSKPKYISDIRDAFAVAADVTLELMIEEVAKLLTIVGQEPLEALEPIFASKDLDEKVRELKKLRCAVQGTEVPLEKLFV